MMRSVVSVVVLALLAACSREGIQRDPQFTDWSYRTRDREHNRYDGYGDYHVREEQWQTDPYWTVGEGRDRREAQAVQDMNAAIRAREAQPAPPLPPVIPPQKSPVKR